MDFPVFVRQRLKELGTEQRDLAAAAEVTESYISQLLTGQEGATRAGAHRHLRQDGNLLAASPGKLATLGAAHSHRTR